MNTMSKLLTGLLVFSMLVVGCAKDKDLDDEKQDKLSQAEADLSSVAGRYSGYLKSNKDGSNLGALQMSLSVTTQVVPSTDETKATAQPLLENLVSFKGSLAMQIAAQNAHYDSGLYQADISITRDGTPVLLKVVAQISHGQMTGTIVGDGYDPQYGGTFALSLNGQSVDQLALEQASAPNILFNDASYIGSTQFVQNGKSAVTKPVNLVLLNPPTTSEVNFLTLLIPVKPVSITLNYGAGASFLLTGTLDQRTNQLFGQGIDPLAPGAGAATGTGTTPATGSSSNAAGTMSLNCTYNNNSQGYDCSLATATSTGPVAFINVAAGKGALPPDNSTTRDAETHAFTGTAVLDANTTLVATLTAVYPARSRTQEVTDLLFPNAEKILQVSVVFGKDKANGVTFATTTWDDPNGTLDATQAYSASGVSGTVGLSCQNFQFTSGPYNFTCQFSSSSRGVNAGLTFKSTP